MGNHSHILFLSSGLPKTCQWGNHGLQTLYFLVDTLFDELVLSKMLKMEVGQDLCVQYKISLSFFAGGLLSVFDEVFDESVGNDRRRAAGTSVLLLCTSDIVTLFIFKFP